MLQCSTTAVYGNQSRTDSGLEADSYRFYGTRMVCSKMYPIQETGARYNTEKSGAPSHLSLCAPRNNSAGPSSATRNPGRARQGGEVSQPRPTLPRADNGSSGRTSTRVQTAPAGPAKESLAVRPRRRGPNAKHSTHTRRGSLSLTLPLAARAETEGACVVAHLAV